MLRRCCSYLSMNNCELLSESLYIRVTPTELNRIDDLAGRLMLTTRAGLAREALRRGLDLILANPAILLKSQEG